MVIIPKPGKDRSMVKVWRPIVLANAVGKLEEKVIADRLQKATEKFHDLVYGWRKDRSAIDVMMMTGSRAQWELLKGNGATLLGKGIVSAFNRQEDSRDPGSQRPSGDIQVLRRLSDAKDV